jgi:hypothetical protein
MAAGAGLKRLAKLYGLVEQRNAMQVRAAAGAMHEVERAVEHLALSRHAELSTGRTALAQGSRVELMAAETTAAAHAQKRTLLAKLRIERRLVHEHAVLEHRASRMERRQIDGVVERSRAAAEVEMERRAQGTADDRFLTRREWTRAAELRERE